MWKIVRVSLLLVVLLVVAIGAWRDRYTSTDWNGALWIGVAPLAGDDSEVVARYVAGLDSERFADIEEFFATEAQRHGIALDEPVHVRLMAQPATAPPQLPRDSGPIGTAWWSLKLRWYAWRAEDTADGVPVQIRIFVHYHDPSRSPSVPHSLGLQKGLIGVVHAFADRGQDGQNSIVIAHELLHTLGATDKYDPATNLPVFPAGYGEPDANPRFPQREAEIMAGRRAISSSQAEMPQDLGSVVMGALTAQEIGWTRRPGKPAT